MINIKDGVKRKIKLYNLHDDKLSEEVILKLQKISTNAFEGKMEDIISAFSKKFQDNEDILVEKIRRELATTMGGRLILGEDWYMIYAKLDSDQEVAIYSLAMADYNRVDIEKYQELLEGIKIVFAESLSSEMEPVKYISADLLLETSYPWLLTFENDGLITVGMSHDNLNRDERKKEYLEYKKRKYENRVKKKNDNDQSYYMEASVSPVGVKKLKLERVKNLLRQNINCG